MMSLDRTTIVLLGANLIVSGALLWTNLMAIGPLASAADAAPQYRSTRGKTPPSGASELTGAAGASTRQRKQMIDRLDAIQKSILALEKTMISGRIAVQVENFDQLEVKFDYDQLRRAFKKESE